MPPSQQIFILFSHESQPGAIHLALQFALPREVSAAQESHTRRPSEVEIPAILTGRVLAKRTGRLPI